VRRLAVPLAVVLGTVGLGLAAVPPAGATPPRPANFATTGDLVEWAYSKVLARSPDPGGLAFWRGHIDGGGDPVVLLGALVHSGEADAWMGQVLRAYRAAYGRGADLGGLSHWLGRRVGAGGRSFREVAYSSFIRSPEFDAKYAGTTDEEFVRRVYANALGRQPDAGGLAYWSGRLNSTSRPQVVFEISESAEHRSRRRIEVEITGAYVPLLGRLPDQQGEAHWRARLAAGASPAELLHAIWTSAELTGRLASVPSLAVTTVVGNLRVPWGLAFAPDGTMLLTQRPGVLTVRLADGTVRDLQADLSDVFAQSEGGLLDLTLDPGFAQNRRFYTCQDRRGPGGDALDVAVVAWTVDVAWRTATRVADPLLAGIPVTSGRHSGCRILPDPAAPGVLFVATGDAAVGTNAQDLSSLGGKLLRISATTGEGAPGNPFASSPDPDTRRIVEWGHRNVQGLAIHPVTRVMVSVEHGPDRDDEINPVAPGRNFGWNPQPGGYNESVPMTDFAEFPDAVGAVWSSGVPTVATSGATFLEGCQWGAFDDHLAVATLKGAHLRIHGLGGALLDLGTTRPAALDGTHGRLRTAVLGPDGALYLTTSNGTGDRVLRVAPSGGRCAA
jgi:glucose/arabinose dehydrogenase